MAKAIAGITAMSCRSNAGSEVSLVNAKNENYKRSIALFFNLVALSFWVFLSNVASSSLTNEFCSISNTYKRFSMEVNKKNVDFPGQRLLNETLLDAIFYLASMCVQLFVCVWMCVCRRLAESQGVLESVNWAWDLGGMNGHSCAASATCTHSLTLICCQSFVVFQFRKCHRTNHLLSSNMFACVCVCVSVFVCLCIGFGVLLFVWLRCWVSNNWLFI